jgi:hypothetical protein
MHAVGTNCYDLVALLFAPATHTATQASKARMRGLAADTPANAVQVHRRAHKGRMLGQVGALASYIWIGHLFNEGYQQYG